MFWFKWFSKIKYFFHSVICVTLYIYAQCLDPLYQLLSDMFH